MSVNAIIREKRKALGFTQKQVADYLGVSTPAVNKWETGSTYPDVALLPALARLLKTDINTLLCFEQELSKKEMGLFLNDVSESFYKNGFEAAFDMSLEKIREFPADAELLHSLAMVLQGCLMLSKMTVEQKESFDAQITSLYERVAQSGDVKYSNSAKYMIASRLINEEQYEKAQELLEELPEYNALDKRSLQANLWVKEGKTKEAAQIYERKLLTNIQETQVALTRLIEIAIQEGDEETASQLALCGQKEAELFGMWKYASFVAPLENAVLNKNVEDTLSILTSMLTELLIPWDMEKSPICKHIKHKPNKDNLWGQMLSSVLTELENSNRYDFLHQNPEFQQLLERYRSKL